MTFRKYSHLIVCLFVVGVILFSSGHHVFANPIVQDVNDTLAQANAQGLIYNTARHNYVVKWIQLERLDMERAALKVRYNSNKTTMEKEAMELASAAAPKSVIPTDYVFNVSDIAVSAAKLAKSASDAVDLQQKLVTKNLEIQKKLVVVSQHMTTLDTAYTHYVAHIDAFNAANKRNKISPSANVTAAGKGYIPPEENKDGVSVDSNLSVKCSNPKCNTVYSASVYGLDNIVTLSEGGSSGGYKGHKVTCSTPHVYWVRYDFDGKGTGERELVPSPYTYWSCPPNTSNCPLRAYHKRKCPGVCGEYNVIAISRFASGYYSPHKVDCKEEIPRSLSSLYLFNECHGTYYSCAGVDTCTNASNHVDDDDDDDSTEQDTEGLQTEQTQTSTPSYHPCGVHQTSVSGTHSAAGCGVSGHYVCDGSDHSLQASCTTTNASGQSCTVSSFYACQSHTHVYPAPVAVSCGRSGCTQTVSSSTEHQVTCSAGHQYWSCGQYANWHANHYRTRTCRYGQCRQSWQRCSRPSSAPTPMCNSPARSGERCWAQS